MVWVGRDLKDHLVPTPLPRYASAAISLSHLLILGMISDN